jgi:hypothetical protein
MKRAAIALGKLQQSWAPSGGSAAHSKDYGLKKHEEGPNGAAAFETACKEGHAKTKERTEQQKQRTEQLRPEQQAVHCLQDWHRGGQGAAAAAAPSAGELSKLTGPELREQLRKRGLPRTGKKAELEEGLLAGWARACCF